MVELAELLVDTLDHADWALFQKNGTDATTACVTLARAGPAGARSSRRAAPIMEPCRGARRRWSGVTAEDRAHLILFDYNDVHEPRRGRRPPAG